MLCSATHSGGCSNNSVREHKQVEPHQLEYVLKEPNDLQRQHVLPTEDRQKMNIVVSRRAAALKCVKDDEPVCSRLLL